MYQRIDKEIVIFLNFREEIIILNIILRDKINLWNNKFSYFCIYYHKLLDLRAFS